MSDLEKKAKEKICFVIGPIGDESSDIRDRADELLDYVIKPCVEPFFYKVKRADKDKLGLITTQIIQNLILSDLVIADLHGYNPNVFYELAIRHATRKPLIQLIDNNEKLPFDIHDVRTIFFDIGKLRSVEKAKSEIIKHIESIEKGEVTEIETPISRATDLKLLKESGDPQKQEMAHVLESISELRLSINEIRNNVEIIKHSSIPRLEEPGDPYKVLKEKAVKDYINTKLNEIRKIWEEKLANERENINKNDKEEKEQ